MKFYFIYCFKEGIENKNYNLSITFERNKKKNQEIIDVLRIHKCI